LNSASTTSFTYQTGINSGNTTIVSIGGTTNTGLSLSGTAITAASTASAAIETLDAAIDTINSARATLGAAINRLTYATDNMTNIASNVTASRSSIMDTDYATASTQLSKTQIISQAATAMLAQANQQPQSVLSLLK